jgi:hypothetical protein
METAMTMLEKSQGELLSVLRIVPGLLFLEHGMQKLLDFPPYLRSDKRLATAE